MQLQPRGCFFLHFCQDGSLNAVLRDNGLSISPMSPLGHHSSSAAPQDSEMKPAKAKKRAGNSAEIWFHKT